MPAVLSLYAGPVTGRVPAMLTLRYVAASLCLGWIATYASENLFWMVPPPDLTLPIFAVTWLFYSAVSAAALSAVLMSGVSGLWAAFLGGAILGFGVEGAVVGTMFDAFPFQLVWTPLAWHALITGGIFVGLARAPMRPGSAVAVWGAVAIAAVAWALYWPSERDVLPGAGALAVYLLLPACLSIPALRVLDRLLPLAPPPRAVLLVAPVLLVLAWIVGTVMAPSPVRLALWPCVALVVWAMRRRADQGGQGGWGRPMPGWQRALPLLPPLAVTVAAPPLWATHGAVATNVPFALATGLASLILLVVALAARPRLITAAAPRPSPPAAR